jgi:tRNA threonylcarbamoyladenosine biosynthesis protein TsaB
VNILGIDTATTGCSAAVEIDGRIVARQSQEMEKGQAERLNPMIGEVMGQAGLTFDGLAGIGVTIGPGAFTGLRIGLAAARAIGFAAAVPVIGMTTFAALARAVPRSELSGRTLVVAVNGKRRDVFSQTLDEDGKTLSEPATLDPATVPDSLPPGPVLIAGDGGPALVHALEACGEAGEGPEKRIRFSSAMAPPDAAHVAALAAQAVAGEGFSLPDAPLRPLYIRPPDARLPDRGRRP